MSRPQAETQDQHGGQPAGRGRSETGPQAQSPGVQQEGTPSGSCLELYTSSCCSEPTADSTDDGFSHLGAFYQVEQILGDEPEVKEKLFSVLKQYAAEKSVEWLASVLPDVLVTEEHRELLSSIR